MHPHLAALARDQHDVFTHRQALTAGYSPAEIRRLVESGEWVRMRRGVLAVAATAARRREEGPRSAHLHQAATVLATLTGPAYLSHRSAALAWELPLLGPRPDRVALTVERQHRRDSAGVELHTARTPDHHRASVDGFAVTSAARTLSDLARQLPFAPSVVAADDALRRGLCTYDDVAQVLHDCWVWPGIARTKRVLEFADRRSESPGESLSRLALADAGLPAPELQVELLLDGRRLRVDFMWPAHRLVGEFDGRVKYGDGRDLWLEKQREDLIRRHGYRIVRWIWADLYPDARVMIQRVSQALRAG